MRGHERTVVPEGVPVGNARAEKGRITVDAMNRKAVASRGGRLDE